MKKIVLVGIVILFILIAGCSENCSIKENATTNQKIIGTVERVVIDGIYHDPKFNEHNVFLIGGGKIVFTTSTKSETRVLVKNFDDVSSWSPGEQYEWILERDSTCPGPWRLASVKRIYV